VNPSDDEAGGKTPVELPHASRLVNHGPTVLVSTVHAGRRNLMAAAWSMPVEFTPPRIAVVIDKSTYTCEQIRETGILALNVPCRRQADLTFTVGNVSGRDVEVGGPDKFDRYGVSSWTGPVLGLPLVEHCVAWMECRVIEEAHTQQAYDTFFVEVLAAWSDTRVFKAGRWSFRDDNLDLHTLHHLGAGVFAIPSDTLQGRMLPEGGALL
jgi:flavin reductase (DIM6/NTAB) family NADH-FMN oxidoreductase RutF